MKESICGRGDRGGLRTFGDRGHASEFLVKVTRILLTRLCSKGRGEEGRGGGGDEFLGERKGKKGEERTYNDRDKWSPDLTIQKMGPVDGTEKGMLLQVLHTTRAST